MVQPEKARSTIRIYRDLLEAAAEEGNAKPTRLLQKANLSHDRLLKHVGELMKLGLLEEVHDVRGRYYKATAKGKDFVREVRRAETFLSAFGVPL